MNEPLCNELRAALHVRLRVILLHPIENVPFEHYFDTCPRDLITAGLLKNIAVQLRSAPYEVCHLASPSARKRDATCSNMCRLSTLSRPAGGECGAPRQTAGRQSLPQAMEGNDQV